MEGRAARFRAGPKELDRELRRAADRLGRVPRTGDLEDVKKVFVIGEIYVRRDNFSVEELSQMLISKGIYPKVAGVTEWIHYTDFARKFILWAAAGARAGCAALRDGVLKEEAACRVETHGSRGSKRRIAATLRPTGLIPDAPHGMNEIIGEGRHEFVDPELESEATVSPAVGAAAMKDGYSGVVIISPFCCLPGRLIEGVYAPWAKARDYPVLSLENDGQSYPPNVVSRMEVFAHNVLRFESNGHSRKAVFAGR